MVTTNRRISRVTPDTYRVLYQEPRQIVVILGDRPDMIGFREKGRRERFYLPIDSMFRQAVRAEANRLAVEKKARRKAQH